MFAAGAGTALSVALVVAPGLAASPAVAQGPVDLSVAAPGSSTPTPFPTYRARVLAESPLLLDAQAAVRATDAAIDVARVLPSARLSAGVSSVDVSGHDAPNATHVVLSMPIDYAGQVGRRVDVRVAEHEATVSIADATRASLSRRAAVLFIDALEAALVHLDAIVAADADAALLRAIEARAALGEATALDVALSRLALASGVARRVEAEGRERSSRIALSGLLGSFDGALAPGGDLRVAPRSFDADALVQEALARRPELRAALLLATAAERERDLSSAARWPQLDVQIGWLHSFASLSPSIFNQPEYDALILGATIEIPIRLAWDGDLRAADAVIERSQAALRARALAISVEVGEALVEYETAREQLATTEAALVEAASLRQAAARATTSGASTVVELLAAQAAAREAESAYIAAAASHARALAVLLARIGRDESIL